MAKNQRRNWHALPDDTAEQELRTDRQSGLSDSDAQERMKEYGPNSLTRRKGKSALQMFLTQFHQPLVYILLGAGGVTLFLKEWVDAAVIMGVVLINAVVGFVQESKAVKAIESLAGAVVSEAVVLRNGKTRKINAAEIVPGDVVLLDSGSKVPADVRLVEVRDLQVDESALTGESVAVQKSDAPVPEEAMLADRTNMGYAGSLVTYGRAKGIVTATGDLTEIGNISRLVSETEELKTPLTERIEKFSRVLLLAILLLSGGMFVIGAFRGEDWAQVFEAAVAMAVGAIPEGLPAAVTIILAIGVSRMARRRAIIRKLPAVETLGSTTIICSDKTGTLTENKMTVRKVFVAGRVFEFSGSGYDPSGEVSLQDDKTDSARKTLMETLRCGLLCNDARIIEKDGRWQVEGDPTEGALLVSARKLKLDEAERERFARLDAIPFESEYQYMAVLVRSGDETTVYMKGSMEAVLKRCSRMMDEREGGPLDKENIEKAADSMARDGLRVLAFARKEASFAGQTIGHDDVGKDLCFLGLQGMIDPPRQEAIRSIQVCREAGIFVKMITGDNAVTAAAIAAEMGLHGNNSNGASAILSGKDLQGKSVEEMSDIVERTVVFARVTPEQKLRLVEAIQRRNHVVAMTGDGVNDAPALKRANIGIAMGRGGTDVAREASDMILTDDNFASIEAAVEEGRGVFDNLTKFILWTLPTNLGEGLVILTAFLVGTVLPILPVQILWVNMTTAMLGIMLAFEPLEQDIMKRPPRDPQTPILTPVLMQRILMASLFMLAGAFGLFHVELSRGSSLEMARTVAVNVIVMVELFYLFNCRSLTKSLLEIGIFSNMWVWAGAAGMMALQLSFTYFPVMNRLFHSEPLSLISWVPIVGVGLLVFLLVELEKWVRQRMDSVGEKESAR